MYFLVKLLFVCVCIAAAVIGLLYITDVLALDELGGVLGRTYGAIGLLFLVAMALRGALAGREVRDESDQRVP